MPSHSKSTDSQKARRARSWLNGEQRKAARRTAQQERMRANIKARKEGTLTPWEQAKALRLNRRAAARELQPGKQS